MLLFAASSLPKASIPLLFTPAPPSPFRPSLRRTRNAVSTKDVVALCSLQAITPTTQHSTRYPDDDGSSNNSRGDGKDKHQRASGGGGSGYDADRAAVSVGDDEGCGVSNQHGADSALNAAASPSMLGPLTNPAAVSPSSPPPFLFLSLLTRGGSSSKSLSQTCRVPMQPRNEAASLTTTVKGM
jgi:hypothetical protein